MKYKKVSIREDVYSMLRRIALETGKTISDVIKELAGVPTKTCYFCGSRHNIHDHHIIPLSLAKKLGINTSIPTIPLCESCHKKLHGLLDPIIKKIKKQIICDTSKIEEEISELKKTLETPHNIESKLRNLEQLLNSLVNGLEVSIRGIKQEISELRNTVNELSDKLEKLSTAPPPSAPTSPTGKGGSRRKKRTIADIMKESKVSLLSEMSIRRPESFLRKAREEGVVAIEGYKDVVLVDRDYWEEFKNRLSELPKEVREGLDAKLLNFLKENGLIYWDGTENKWVLTIKE